VAAVSFHFVTVTGIGTNARSSVKTDVVTKSAVVTYAIMLDTIMKVDSRAQKA